jgi:uncharacterized protein (TIGR02001 family)
MTMNRPIPTASAAIAFLACGFAAFPAHAQLSFNGGVTNDYRYRGISQSRLRPALQLGVDYAFESGLYVGAWASSIQWIKDVGGKAQVELDVYGGYKGKLGGALSYDVGVLNYDYRRNKLGTLAGLVDANTTEIYGAVTYSVATLKYSHALTNTFGNPDSKNSFYLDLSAGLDVGAGITLTPHVGYQKIKGPNSGVGSYKDYSIAASKDFSGLLVSAGFYGTDADKTFYSSPANGKFLGRNGVSAGVKYTF